MYIKMKINMVTKVMLCLATDSSMEDEFPISLNRLVTILLGEVSQITKYLLAFQSRTIFGNISSLISSQTFFHWHFAPTNTIRTPFFII